MDSQGIMTRSAAVASAAYLAYVAGMTTWSKKVNGSTKEQASRVGWYSAAAVATVGVLTSGLLTTAIRSLRAH